MISPYYHALSYNVYIYSWDCISILWTHICVNGQIDDFSFSYIVLIYRIYTRTCFIARSIVHEGYKHLKAYLASYTQLVHKFN